MVLYLQLGDRQALFGKLESGEAAWRDREFDRDPFPALAEAMEKFGLGTGSVPPVAVVLGLPEADSGLRASWSLIRSGVAMANGLAFAWGVPAASLTVRGDEGRESLAAEALAVASRAKAGEWIGAAYSGEPNITKPKA